MLELFEIFEAVDKVIIATNGYQHYYGTTTVSKQPLNFCYCYIRRPSNFGKIFWGLSDRLIRSDIRYEFLVPIFSTTCRCIILSVIFPSKNYFKKQCFLYFLYILLHINIAYYTKA